MIFINILLPVILIFLSGFIVQRFFRVNIIPISTISIYILSPALVFDTFYSTPLDMKLIYLLITQTILFFALVLVAIIASRLGKQDKEQESALILTSAFANSGNYGAPVVLFALGEAGMKLAITIMVFHSILGSIFGVYFAARGKTSLKTSIKTVIKQPSNYAIILAIFFQQLGITIPANFYETIEMVGMSAIPVIMILLGMQLAEVKLQDFHLIKMSVASAIRLVISPILAYFICLLFPLDPLLRDVTIILAAMPSAATAVMYSVQFNAKPQFVSSVTLITTLLSFVTLSILLSIM